MLFRSALDSLWGIIKSPFFLDALATPPPPTSSNISTPPPEDKHIKCDITTNDEFLSVDCTRVSNRSAEASMPGAYHPDLPAHSTSSIGCPGYGLCPYFISTSPSLSSGCEVEFGDTRFAGYSTSERPPTCAFSPPSPYGGDRPTKPVIYSYRYPTSSFPERSGFAGFTPSANGNFSTLTPPDSARSAGSAIPGGYSTSPWPGYSRHGYPGPSTDSSFSSSDTSFFPFSPLTSLPFSPPSPLSSSPHPSAPLSGLSTSPAAAANPPSTQDNNNLQSSPKQECKFDTKAVNMPEPLSGNQVLSEPTQAKASEERIPTPHSRPPFPKNRESRQCPSYTAVAEDLPESELRSGKIIGENEHVSCARKRALQLDHSLEALVDPNFTEPKPSRIPVLKKARFSAKSSDSNTTAEAAATARGNTGTRVPPKIPPRTYPARMETQAESSAFPAGQPPPGHITPAKLETPGNCRRGKRAQGDDAAKGPTHKKLKTHSGTPHKKTPKRKPRKVVNSGKTPRRTKAIPSPSNGQPASHLPRPAKPHNLSVSAGELAGGSQAAPIHETPLAKVTSPRKRRNENTIVKCAVTKWPRKKYFLRGMVLSDESSDDEEIKDEGLEMKGAQSATPLEAAHTSTTTSSTSPANTPELKSPLASILGKRTSTDAQGSDARDTGGKKIKLEPVSDDEEWKSLDEYKTPPPTAAKPSRSRRRYRGY